MNAFLNEFKTFSFYTRTKNFLNLCSVLSLLRMLLIISFLFVNSISMSSFSFIMFFEAIISFIRVIPIVQPYLTYLLIPAWGKVIASQSIQQLHYSLFKRILVVTFLNILFLLFRFFLLFQFLLSFPTNFYQKFLQGNFSRARISGYKCHTSIFFNFSISEASSTRNALQWGIFALLDRIKWSVEILKRSNINYPINFCFL